MTEKWVYHYHELPDAEQAKGSKEKVHSLLGDKGYHLATMSQMGLPVPPGFIVTSEACSAYLARGNEFAGETWQQIKEALDHISARQGKVLGDPTRPLFVSCRSGAKVSMPGIMGTVLNLGLNDETASGFAEQTGDPAFVYSAYCRLIQKLADVAYEVPSKHFLEAREAHRHSRGYSGDEQLEGEDWKYLARTFHELFKEHVGHAFPQHPLDQIEAVTRAIFVSWHSERARKYRHTMGIPDDLGTAVNVVTMVFGNLGEDSGSGVAFSRNPDTGEKHLFGSYLMNAQGDEVVSGARTTKSLSEMAEDLPEAYRELAGICTTLESHYRDMQDVEFTIEQGTLWILQTRTGERTAQAAMRIAVDLFNEQAINKHEAVTRVTPEQVQTLLHPYFEPEALKQSRAEGNVLTRGVAVSPGAAVGGVCLSLQANSSANERTQDNLILVRPSIDPEQISEALDFEGILTSEGGAASHAAVIARQRGVPCVTGATDLTVDFEAERAFIGDTEIEAGTIISINGSTGEVLQGEVAKQMPDFREQTALRTVLAWADEIAAEGPKVWANADEARGAQRAREYGAQGIGLCRTEHMFLGDERLPLMQQYILADDRETGDEALEKLLPVQRADFEELFKVMAGMPVVVRLIDPPLHEFLPDIETLIEKQARTACGKDAEDESISRLLEQVRKLQETNPMMGLRGVRLALLKPAIVTMQIRAIFEAALNIAEHSDAPHIKIMVPLASFIEELEQLLAALKETVSSLLKNHDTEVPHSFGTMVETPRAALQAGEFAAIVDFLSFGTNDLTQFTLGFSRDDAERSFLGSYQEHQILANNPFQVLDTAGVGALLATATNAARKANPDIEIGICGEHAADPKSIEFCANLDLDYVSCASYRVPVARLAVAHGQL